MKNWNQDEAEKEARLLDMRRRFAQYERAGRKTPKLPQDTEEPGALSPLAAIALALLVLWLMVQLMG